MYFLVNAFFGSTYRPNSGVQNSEISDKHEKRKSELWKTHRFGTCSLLVVKELVCSCSSPIGIEVVVGWYW